MPLETLSRKGTVAFTSCWRVCGTTQKTQISVRKKKSENLGLRETRQRRESQDRATAEMRRAEMGEDRPAVTHKTGTPPLTYQLR